MREFEIKVPVTDLSEIELKLKELGAVYSEYKEELDYYIDARPCVDLASSDSALRLRVLKDLQSGSTHSELTFKGPREKHDFAKIRSEITVSVSDPTAMLEIFKKLGFGILAKVYKKRKVYSYGPYKIYLDDVEGLGKFIEVEYVGEGIPSALIENEIVNILTLLNIPKNFVTKSYLELLLDKLNK
uniref:Class IV adenylate cyclase n=1 Tax=Ignisphaera aggregans TaxID=334771 RepID=A0A7C2ZNI4_9CREN